MKPNPDKAADAQQQQEAEAGNQPINPNSGAAKFLAKVIAITPKKPKTPAEPKPEGEKDPENPDAAKPKPAPKPAARPMQPVIDEERLGRSIAEGLAPHLKREEKPKEEPRETGLSAKNQRKLEVFERMSALNKDRYGDLPQKFTAGVKKLSEYKAQWEQEHPGQEFDEAAEEHAEFIDSVSSALDYEDEDFTDAIADMRADRKIEEKLKPVAQELKTLKTSKLAEQEMPQAQARGAAAAKDFYSALGDDFKHLIGAEGVDSEAMNNLKDNDPDAHEILTSMAQSAATMASEIHLIGRGLREFDPAKNELHRAISGFALKMERQYMAAPIEERTDDKGRTFVTAQQWAEMPEKARANHWTFSPDDLIYMESRSFAAMAKKDLTAAEEKFNRAAKARGIETTPRGQRSTTRLRPITPARERENAHELAEDDEDPADPASRKPQTPMSPNSPSLAASLRKKGGGSQSPVESFTSKFLG